MFVVLAAGAAVLAFVAGRLRDSAFDVAIVGWWTHTVATTILFAAIAAVRRSALRECCGYAARASAAAAIFSLPSFVSCSTIPTNFGCCRPETRNVQR